jgi:vacuolar-type H+-ATPase catalytic subunit A/Vma1
MKFHSTTLGKFGRGLSTDQEGYAYTTIREYMRECGYDREYARDAAERSREAIRELERWQEEN